MIKSITTMKPVWNSSATHLGPPWRLERGDGVVLVYAGERDIHPAIEIPLSNIAEIAYDTEAMAQDQEVQAKPPERPREIEAHVPMRNQGKRRKRGKR